MTQQNNNARSFDETLRIIRKLATERAQADEMEIKEMDPNGNAVIATEQSVTVTNAEPEDSLYFGEERKRVVSYALEENQICIIGWKLTNRFACRKMQRHFVRNGKRKATNRRWFSS